MEAGRSTRWRCDGDVAVVGHRARRCPRCRCCCEAAARRATVRVRLPRQAAAALDPVRAAAARPGSGTSSGATTSTTSSARTASTASRATSTRRRDGAFERPAGFDLRDGVPERPQAARRRRRADAVAVVRGRRASGPRVVERELGADARSCAASPTAPSRSRCRAPTCRRSARGCSACSTTPRCSGPPDVRADVVGVAGATGRPHR